jgi:hypothetical protein
MLRYPDPRAAAPVLPVPVPPPNLDIPAERNRDVQLPPGVLRARDRIEARLWARQAIEARPRAADGFDANDQEEPRRARALDADEVRLSAPEVIGTTFRAAEDLRANGQREPNRPRKRG